MIRADVVITIVVGEDGCLEEVALNSKIPEFSAAKASNSPPACAFIAFC